jgi:hypothetical protein
MSSLNWSDLIKDAGEPTSYEPLPDGDYELKVIESKAKNTQSGKTMFSITTEVQGGPHAKRRVWDNLTVSPENPKALAIFFSKMESLGLPRDFFTASNPSNAQIEQALLGRSFRGTLGKKTYNGTVSNEITKYFRLVADATAGAPVPPAPAAAPAPAPAAPVATPFDGPSVANAAPAPAPAPAPAAPVSSEEPF